MLFRSLQRCGIRQDHADVEISLVFIGQEGVGDTTRNPYSGHGDKHQEDERKSRFANEEARGADVGIAGATKGVVEPAEEVAQRTTAGLLRFEQQSAERRAERQCIEGGEEHRYRDGDSELLIKASGDAGHGSRSVQ